MRLNSLRLVNFRQHADSRIAFDAGLTGIIGPNGSGKTTILEAVAWALYGNSAARGTRESLRFSRAPARASVRVELDFELGGHRYLVVRGLTNAELYLDGALAPIANSITGVSELLQRRLGMTRGEFFNTYFTGQKELNVMAAMGPSERAKFLSRVLGYEKLRVAQDLVRDRRKLIGAEIAGLRSGMPDAETVARSLAEAAARLADVETRSAAAAARLTADRAVLDAAQPTWERAQRERERWQEVTTELKVAERDVDALGRDAERVARELEDVRVARVELDGLRAQLAVFPGLVQELHSADALYREEGRRQTLLVQARELAVELDGLRERQSKLEAAPGLETEVTAELQSREAEEVGAQAQFDERRTVWVRDQQEAKAKLRALSAQVDDFRQQRDRLVAAGPDQPCPTCTRPLGKQFQQVVDLVEEQLGTATVDETYYRSRVQQLEQAPPELAGLEERWRALGQDVTRLRRKLAKVQAGVQELRTVRREVDTKATRQEQLTREIAAIPAGYDVARHTHLRAEVERLAPLDARAARLGASVEREPQLARERARIESETATLAGVLRQLRERRDVLGGGFDEGRYAEVRVRWEQAAAAMRNAELADVTARGELDAARSMVRTAEGSRRALDLMQAKLDALQSDRRLHDELDRAYSDLRTDLNFQLRPEVSELASGFLTDLTDARYSELELDDQYNIIVLEDGVPKPVISGGEEDLANLVLRLAISQMIADRAGQPFSLLILDEVFGSLDEARRHNVVELLRRLHDRFEQVIVITHIESVREGLDQVLVVRFDEARGTSVIEDRQPGSDDVAIDAGLELVGGGS